MLKDLQLKNKSDRIFYINEKGSRLKLHHREIVLAEECADNVHLVAPERIENVIVASRGSAIGQVTLFKAQRMKTESLGKLVPRSVPQTTQKCSTTSDIFVNWLRHFAMFKATGCSLLAFDRVTLHLVEADETYNVTQYCHVSSTTHEIVLWISQCSEASNTLEMKKCPVTHLKNRCAQVQNCDLQKSSPLRGMKH
jgi:hypothetical protein